MADLIQAFFERDLAEAESQALETLLKNSIEAASRFEALSEEAYSTTGLPPHQWPGAAIPIHPIGGWGTGFKILAALVAAGGGFTLWRIWNQAPMEMSLKAAAPSTILASPHGLAPSVIPQKIQVSKALKEAEGDQLSVLVETEQSSLVTVRILNPQGREIRALYAGVLDPGQWSFQWDGLLANGKPASSGPYRIEVQNGAHVLSKMVSLESR